MSDAELGTSLAGAMIQPNPMYSRVPTPRGRILLRDWWVHFYRRPSFARVAAANWREWAQPLVRPGRAPRHGIALELVAESGVSPRSGVDIIWLAETLGSAEYVSAVHYVTAPAQAPAEWLWPLDLALYDDADSRGLRESISHLHWRRFVTPVSTDRATAPIELLVLPSSLRDALASVLTHAAPPRVQAVLVLGGHAGAPDALAMADVLRGCARADGVCIAHIPLDRHPAFLDGVLVELSHGLDLDVAVAAACRGVGARPPLMVGASGAFARAHLSVWGQSVSSRVRRTPALVIPTLRFMKGTSAVDVGRELAEGMAGFMFDSERNEATDIADLGHAARGEPPGPGSRERLVQAELFGGAGAEATKIERSPLTAGAYRLDVWIGPPTQGALIAPAPFPESELPPSSDGHVLIVAFTAPALGGEPQVKRLVLPPTGPSKRVEFAFDIPEVVRRLEARIAVLHENRVLQTLLLIADVIVGEPTPLGLGLEAVVRRDLDAVGGRRPFDAALITNQLSGQRTVSVFAGERASLVPADASIERLTLEVSALLEQATNNAKKYGKPDSAGTLDLLAALARIGVLLRDALLDMGLHADLAQAKRIQIIAAKPHEPTLPLEICYDGTAPADGAAMCPQWTSALTAGACQPDCPLDRGTVVCPVAFWGTSRTIERHAYATVDLPLLGANAYALQSEPADGRSRLAVAPGSLCAAADKARAVDKDAVDQAFVDAGNVAMPNSEVGNWEKWQAAIAQNPSLLVLLAHTDRKQGIRTLVIGAAETAFISSVDEHYVGRGAGQGPVVLLLGCSTGIAELAFQSFVARFRRAGASIVIGTLCEILGQHAAPIASEILKELRRAGAAAEGIPFGDFVPALRRRLLARGYPIVMAIAPYGDADWRI